MSDLMAEVEFLYEERKNLRAQLASARQEAGELRSALGVAADNLDAAAVAIDALAKFGAPSSYKALREQAAAARAALERSK